jgi:glycosyltransferase involved in cell wall biosynthesis
LPTGVLLKKFGHTKVLIYDPHELETERVGLRGKGQQLTKWLERKLIRFADKTIVVCDPIADWYKKKYALEHVYVIRNMPNRLTLPRKKSTLLKGKFNIPNNHVLYIYQGILTKERGIDTLLQVFGNAPKDKHIVFMGYGDSESVIKEVAKTAGNIHFQEAVRPAEIIDYTSSADIGIFFITGQVCLSYQYCLPNKFGEYLIAGLPVLVSSSLTYLSGLVVDKKCGWSLDANSITELSDFVTKTEMVHVSEKQKDVERYSGSLGWEFEETGYAEIYQ